MFVLPLSVRNNKIMNEIEEQNQDNLENLVSWPRYKVQKSSSFVMKDLDIDGLP